MLNITIYTDDREESAETLEEIADLIRCGKEPSCLLNITDNKTKTASVKAVIEWK